MSVKDFFSKIGFLFTCVLASFVGLFFRKVVSDNGKRTVRNLSADRCNDVESRRADRISEEAGKSAQSIHDIIERVRTRERETEKQS